MRRGRWGLLVAVATGLLASGALYWYLISLEPRYQVVVAATSLEPGHLIRAGQVRLAYVPKKDLNALAITQVESVIGKFPRERIYPGEQLLQPRLATAAETGVIAGLPEGLRAMYLALPPEQLGGGLARPGAQVDVIFVSNGRESPSHARVVLQGLKVLEIRDDQGRGWTEGKGSPAGVVLAVTAQEAEILAFCREHGVVYLMLRHPEAVAQHTPGVSWEGLYEYALDARGPEALPGGEASSTLDPQWGRGGEKR